MTYSPRERSVIVLESSYAYEGRDSRIDSRIRSMCPRMASGPIATGPCLSSWCGCVLHTTYYACRSTARGGRFGVDARSADRLPSGAAPRIVRPVRHPPQQPFGGPADFAGIHPG